MAVGPDIGYAIGAFGVALTVVTQRIERRRARPVVVCHEDQKRHFIEGGRQAASVYLTNESAASAFNVRFGIDVRGVHVGWKHSQADPEWSRLNVLRPNEREPSGQGLRDIIIADAVLWSMGADHDPDEGRSYWAYYQSPTGDWWYTSNPTNRSDDLTIKRIRSGRFGALSRQKRQLDHRLREGSKTETEAIGELRKGAEREPPSGGNASPDE